MPIDIDLDAIEARANAATPGPWGVGNGTNIVRGLEVTGRGSYTCIQAVAEVADEDEREDWRHDSGDDYADVDPEEDATFIAHARTDVPALIAEVRRLREQIYAQKPVIDAVNTWAEAHEDGDHEATIRAAADLYGAVEEYRLMDHALTTAREEQPETSR